MCRAADILFDTLVLIIQLLCGQETFDDQWHWFHDDVIHCFSITWRQNKGQTHVIIAVVSQEKVLGLRPGLGPCLLSSHSSKTRTFDWVETVAPPCDPFSVFSCLSPLTTGIDSDPEQEWAGIYRRRMNERCVTGCRLKVLFAVRRSWWHMVDFCLHTQPSWIFVSGLSQSSKITSLCGSQKVLSSNPNKTSCSFFFVLTKSTGSGSGSGHALWSSKAEMQMWNFNIKGWKVLLKCRLFHYRSLWHVTSQNAVRGRPQAEGQSP